MKSNQKRNSGALVWDRAKQIIPGGNQLLSKRAEQFLPEFWPAYYQKAVGCKIQDLDSNWLRDFSIMGIGTCSLGYANPEVTAAVVNAVTNGSMCTLNCHEEVELAEALLQLHPWSAGARFTRSGGEACSLAVRIARSFSQKDLVMFSGYHGWHDWYLATNINDASNLNSQLLPGLSPSGVPLALGGTAIPFHEGNSDEFDAKLSAHKGQVGVVIMEVWRYAQPDLEFISHVRKRCTEENIVLIFDEISSGFRLNIGGSHSIWGLEPDMCVLGKALGNGHPIGAVIGKKDVMNAAQSSFISSSYWTERVGFAASLKTLEIFQRDDVATKLLSIGKTIKDGLKEIIAAGNNPIEVIGVDSVPIIVFGGDQGQALKTLFTQEMLKRGFLASNVIYVSIAHGPDDVAAYLTAATEVLNILEDAIAGDINEYLDGPVSHSGFQRLTK
jgi:glutamate-1-semialdehyde 2,1-aminomutase